VLGEITKPFQLSTLFKRAGLGDLTEEPQLSHDPQTSGILVVDDEPGVRSFLQRHLQCRDYRVWTASHAEEALDHCCDHGDDIGVVLLDAEMPGLDSAHTLDGIFALNPAMPVCLMTGNSGEPELDGMLVRGARHLLSKPFRLEEVVGVIRQLTNEATGELQVR